MVHFTKRLLKQLIFDRIACSLSKKTLFSFSPIHNAVGLHIIHFRPSQQSLAASLYPPRELLHNPQTHYKPSLSCARHTHSSQPVHITDVNRQLSCHLWGKSPLNPQAYRTLALDWGNYTQEHFPSFKTGILLPHNFLSLPQHKAWKPEDETALQRTCKSCQRDRKLLQVKLYGWPQKTVLALGMHCVHPCTVHAKDKYIKHQVK